MRTVLRLFIFLVVVQIARCFMDWWDIKRIAWGNRKRILQIENQLMTDLETIVSEIKDIRFMYEESPHYEIGYVYAEIMEKYRKMVDHVYHVSSHPESMFHTQTYLEKQQNLYLDNYHLICMIHEIPKKYASTDEFKMLEEATQTGDTSELTLTFEEQKDRSVALAKEKKRIDRLKKQRQKKLQRADAISDIIKQLGGAYGSGQAPVMSAEAMKRPPKRVTTPHTGLTPKGRYYEYGWELNYEWWGDSIFG